jgi:Fe-S-cluster containining protein
MSELKQIVLRSSAGAVRIPSANVYYAFGDGRFPYDCVSCNAKCCRGYGYLAAAGAEFDRQVNMRRTLPLFAAPAPDRGTAQFQISNCAPGCFFLSDDGRCEIHATAGFDAKPETCRLFPFNNLRRLGPYLIVAPHSSLCPLAVSYPERSSCSDHAALFESLAAQPIAARVRGFTSEFANPADLIARERQIVTLSDANGHARSYLPFVAGQILLDTASAGSTSTGIELVTDAVNRIAAVLGTPRAESFSENPELVRTMIAVTPFLRAQLVLAEQRPADKPQQRPVTGARVALSILATYLLGDAAMTAGMKEISFQTLAKLSQDFRALISMLACLPEVMVWRDRAPIDAISLVDANDRRRFVRIAKALMASSQRHTRVPLGDVLSAHAPGDAVHRVLFMKAVADRLAGHLTEIDGPESTSHEASPRQRVSNAFNRWMIVNFDEDLVQSVYERQRRGAAANVG